MARSKFTYYGKLTRYEKKKGKRNEYYLVWFVPEDEDQEIALFATKDIIYENRVAKGSHAIFEGKLGAREHDDRAFPNFELETITVDENPPKDIDFGSDDPDDDIPF